MSEAETKPVITDEDLKKMEEDVKKASSEEQRELVEKAFKEATEKLETKRKEEEQNARIAELEAEKEKYAQSLEELKKQTEENTKKLIKEFEDSRQSVVNTRNPFNDQGQQTQSATETPLMEKYRNDAEFRDKLDRESAKAFAEKHRIGIHELNLPYR